MQIELLRQDSALHYNVPRQHWDIELNEGLTSIQEGKPLKAQPGALLPIHCSDLLAPECAKQSE